MSFDMLPSELWSALPYAAALLVAVGLAVTARVLKKRKARQNELLASFYATWREPLGLPETTSQQAPYTLKSKNGVVQEVQFIALPVAPAVDVLRSITAALGSEGKQEKGTVFTVDFGDLAEGDLTLRRVQADSAGAKAQAIEFRVFEALQGALGSVTYPTIELLERGGSSGFRSLVVTFASGVPNAGALAQATELLRASGDSPWAYEVVSSSVVKLQEATEEELQTWTDDEAGDDGNGDMGDLDGLLTNDNAALVDATDTQLEELLDYSDEEDSPPSTPPPVPTLLSPVPRIAEQEETEELPSPPREEAQAPEAPLRRARRRESPAEDEAPATIGKYSAPAEVVGWDEEYDEPIFAKSSEPVESIAQDERPYISDEAMEILRQAVRLAESRNALDASDEDIEIVFAEAALPREFIVHLEAAQFIGSPEFKGFLADMTAILEANFQEPWEGGPMASPDAGSLLFSALDS